MWSALGAASADVLFVYRQSHPQTAPFDGPRLTAAYAELEARAGTELAARGFEEGSVSLGRRASLRHRYQIHEIEIEVPPAEELWAQGTKALEGTTVLGVYTYVDYEKAIEKFQSIVDNYPNSDWYTDISERQIRPARSRSPG